MLGVMFACKFVSGICDLYTVRLVDVGCTNLLCAIRE